MIETLRMVKEKQRANLQKSRSEDCECFVANKAFAKRKVATVGPLKGSSRDPSLEVC